jgi:hypothetical protein
MTLAGPNSARHLEATFECTINLDQACVRAGVRVRFARLRGELVRSHVHSAPTRMHRRKGELTEREGAGASVGTDTAVRLCQEYLNCMFRRSRLSFHSSLRLYLPIPPLSLSLFLSLSLSLSPLSPLSLLSLLSHSLSLLSSLR